MTRPIRLDAADRPRPIRSCWTCGREVPVIRRRASTCVRTGGVATHTPHRQLVRRHDRVPAGAERRRVVAARADLGAGSDGKPALAVRAARAALTARGDSAGPGGGGAAAGRRDDCAGCAATAGKLRKLPDPPAQRDFMAVRARLGVRPGDAGGPLMKANEGAGEGAVRRGKPGFMPTHPSVADLGGEARALRGSHSGQP